MNGHILIYCSAYWLFLVFRGIALYFHQKNVRISPEAGGFEQFVAFLETTAVAHAAFPSSFHMTSRYNVVQYPNAHRSVVCTFSELCACMYVCMGVHERIIRISITILHVQTTIADFYNFISFLYLSATTDRNGLEPKHDFNALWMLRYGKGTIFRLLKIEAIFYVAAYVSYKRTSTYYDLKCSVRARSCKGRTGENVSIISNRGGFLFRVGNTFVCGHTIAQLVEALWYKPEDCGFDSRWGNLIFQFT
jgi:hypothetical protein